ncbi:hypothetical protein [Polaromonas glacialis]|uniref:hypothetical protein n=1 Tax=Polaromonas glacialis TaxID=866564 RepID=UPI0012EC5825|nr:hypothetical protein [Polaromonas glacialis]
MPTPNDDRSRVKDPLQPDFKANQDNRSRQLNPQQQEQEPAMDPEGQTGSSPRPGAGAEKDK